MGVVIIDINIACDLSILVYLIPSTVHCTPGIFREACTIRNVASLSFQNKIFSEFADVLTNSNFLDSEG